MEKLEKRVSNNEAWLSVLVEDYTRRETEKKNAAEKSQKNKGLAIGGVSVTAIVAVLEAIRHLLPAAQ